MMNSGFSIADVMALAKDNDGFGGNCGGSMWIFILFFFFLFAGGGNGFGGFGGNTSDIQGTITRGEMYEGFMNNNMSRQLEDIGSGISSLGYAENTTMLNGFNSQNITALQGFNALEAQLARNAQEAQACCCTTQRSIDSVKYENAQNTCAITSAIHADGEATRALITANTMQELRDRLADKDREVLAASFELSQQAQSAAIIDRLQPMSKPAYITCSPYESYNLPCMTGCGN